MTSWRASTHDLRKLLDREGESVGRVFEGAILRRGLRRSVAALRRLGYSERARMAMWTPGRTEVPSCRIRFLRRRICLRSWRESGVGCSIPGDKLSWTKRRAVRRREAVLPIRRPILRICCDNSPTGIAELSWIATVVPHGVCCPVKNARRVVGGCTGSRNDRDRRPCRDLKR